MKRKYYLPNQEIIIRFPNYEDEESEYDEVKCQVIKVNRDFIVVKDLEFPENTYKYFKGFLANIDIEFLNG